MAMVIPEANDLEEYPHIEAKIIRRALFGIPLGT